MYMADIHVHIYTYIYVPIYVYIHMYIYIYIYLRAGTSRSQKICATSFPAMGCRGLGNDALPSGQVRVTRRRL